jgi:hypothetical protein
MKQAALDEDFMQAIELKKELATVSFASKD